MQQKNIIRGAFFLELLCHPYLDSWDWVNLALHTTWNYNLFSLLPNQYHCKKYNPFSFFRITLPCLDSWDWLDLVLHTTWNNNPFFLSPKQQHNKKMNSCSIFYILLCHSCSNSRDGLYLTSSTRNNFNLYFLIPKIMKHNLCSVEASQIILS